MVAFITTNTYDSGDSIKHYLFARHAFQYPMNYMDSWAKPLFTLISSVPAQAGFIGMKLFQCGVAENAAAWIRKTYGSQSRPLAYEFPYVALATQNNFFDPNEHPPIRVNQDGLVESLPVGTLLVWDDWFARTEGYVQLPKLRADARFREVYETAQPRNRFHPERDTTRIIVFERVQ